ncbi:MAG: thioredoxin family protein [Myxococcales bacterium]|nr:thioredoxin family protein [Myxococcales bacterium]
MILALVASFVSLGLTARAAPADPLRWHHDDAAAALAEARAAGKPLLVDLWAPWCHTCLSMQQTVLRDPKLAPYADRFVWLALDTDRPANAAFVAKHPPSVWPTFHVIDPRAETVEARLLGAAGIAQFIAFLDEGLAVYAAADAAGSAALARVADRLAAAGAHAAAAEGYTAALAATAPDSPRRPALIVSRINALYRAGDLRGCLAVGDVGLAEVGRGHTPAAADFVYYLHACATQLGLDDRARALLGRGLVVIDAALADAGAPLTVDDRSEALRIARELHLALGNAAAARARAEAQRDLLDRAARGADPRRAMTWSWPRAEVYAFLGEPAKLVPEIEALARALPAEYDPPYRLAWLRLRAGQLDGARAAAKDALGKVYGPRTARVWRLLAEIEVARGDTAAARAALVGAIESLRAQPAPDAAAIAEAEAALAAHDAKMRR